MDLPVNLPRLRKKAADIRSAMEKLVTFTVRPAEEYLQDDQSIAASKYYLLVVTEAAIDICNHLAARPAKQAPESYADCFQVLTGAKIISPPLAERLTRMARFRNLLIHQYGDVDEPRRTAKRPANPRRKQFFPSGHNLLTPLTYSGCLGPVDFCPVTF